MKYFILEKNPEYKEKHLSHLYIPQFIKISIGVSCSGRVFELHKYPSKNINNFADWLNILENPNTIIIDENDARYSSNEMLNIITKRKQPLERLNTDLHFIEQGDGDYDLIDQEEWVKFCNG